MTLEPLLAASPAIQLHVAAAIGSFVLGIAQFALPKGVGLHRAMGWTWVFLMVVVAVSSFWIHAIRSWGDWSPIHILSIVVLLSLPLAVVYARRGYVRGHSRVMIFVFVGVVAAGLFTFVPGRIIYSVIF